MWEKIQILRQKYLDLRLDQVLNYEKFAMISIVYHSTRIEGCSLSESDTSILLEKDITAKGKPLSDHLMVKDHFTAFEFIRDQANQKKEISLSFLQEVASRVMKNTRGPINTISGSFDTSKGDLRLAQVYVDKKYFPDFKKVETLLNQLIENISIRMDQVTGIEVLKLAADVHCNLVNIHPFGDGNGRTARLMMNYIQMYHKEPLIKIFTEDRSEYIETYNKAEEEGDIRIFHDFICLQQIKFFENEIEKYGKKDRGFSLLF